MKLSSAFLSVAMLACPQAGFAQTFQDVLISAARGGKDTPSSNSQRSSVSAEKEQSAEDALRSIRFVTRSKFIVMPVFDKSGSSQQYGSAGGPSRQQMNLLQRFLMTQCGSLELRQFHGLK